MPSHLPIGQVLTKEPICALGPSLNLCSVETVVDIDGSPAKPPTRHLLMLPHAMDAVKMLLLNRLTKQLHNNCVTTVSKCLKFVKKFPQCANWLFCDTRWIIKKL